MAFGGSYKEWAKDENLKGCATPCAMVVGFYAEMQEIQNGIAPNYFPEFDKFIKIAHKENTKKGTMKNDKRIAIALYLQDWEAKIMLSLHDYASSKLGYTVEALIHDELLIRGDVEKELESKMNDIYFHIYQGNRLPRRIGMQKHSPNRRG